MSHAKYSSRYSIVFTEHLLLPRSWSTVGNKTERMPVLNDMLQKTNKQDNFR